VVLRRAARRWRQTMLETFATAVTLRSQRADVRACAIPQPRINDFRYIRHTVELREGHRYLMWGVRAAVTNDVLRAARGTRRQSRRVRRLHRPLIRSALFEPNLMTSHVKVQRLAVQVGLILDARRNDGLEASRASLAGTLTCPHAPGVIALDIARPEHSSNALADLFFVHQSIT